MSTEKNRNITEVNLNNNLSTIYVDNIIPFRRNDGVYFIRCLSQLPQGLFEQARLMIDNEHIKSIINNLCKSADYYPTKSQKTTNSNVDDISLKP